MSQLTVKELIDLLEAQPPDAVVYTEGCDCYGKAVNVCFDDSDGSVVISRDNWE